MNTITQPQNHVTIIEHNTATTLSRDDWYKIVDAIQFLSNKGATLEELEQVATIYTRKPEHLQALFWAEFWAMIGYKNSKKEILKNV